MSPTFHPNEKIVIQFIFLPYNCTNLLQINVYTAPFFRKQKINFFPVSPAEWKLIQEIALNIIT